MTTCIGHPSTYLFAKKTNSTATRAYKKIAGLLVGRLPKASEALHPALQSDLPQAHRGLPRHGLPLPRVDPSRIDRLLAGTPGAWDGL